MKNPRILILQHPQEKKETLATAPLLTATLGDRAVLKTGLSWANFAKALGELKDPKKWMVLYLGSRTAGKTPPRPPKGQSALYWVGKKGDHTPPTAEELKDMEGVVVLDGSWKQAKTLWWRNPWLLKLRRAVILPAEASLYGKLRREPRRECLSSLEAVGLALTSIGEPDATRETLLTRMRELLEKQPQKGKAAPAAPAPKSAD